MLDVWLETSVSKVVMVGAVERSSSVLLWRGEVAVEDGPVAMVPGAKEAKQAASHRQN